MQDPPIKQLAQKQRCGSFCIFIPLFIGLNIGWCVLQERYVPLEERRDHPLVTLYKKYIT